MSDPSTSLIAVVGMSALLPGSASPGGFWRDILGSRDLFRDVPATHWRTEDLYDPDPSAVDKTYCKRGAFLDPVAFDPIEFGIPPSVLPATDTSQLLALVVARQVLEDATGGQLAHLDRDRVSVILGVSASQKLMGFMASRVQRPIWARVLRETGVPAAQVEAICDRIAAHYVPFQEATFPGILNNVVAGRIANRLDLGGTNCTTDAACASSLAALHMAANELHLGQSDLVITGGVDTLNDPFTYVCFSKTPALSMAGECRPFDTAADGTLLGEGIAMVALRRLKDAERDGDRIYAVLRGIGSSSDGRARSIYAPLAAGQAKAVRRAYAAAGYGPDSVELLEAHGTGTKAGDLAELTGLKEVFAATGRPDRQWCALGSVKSQIGHTKGAAGAASLLKVLLSLQHKVLPPTLHVTQPNPRMDFASSPFYLNSEARPWIRDCSHPRRAALSSFGFGGSNFHATIEEYTGSGAALRLRTSPTELVLLGAETAPMLAALATATAPESTDEEPGLLPYLARSSQESFQSAQPFRLAVVAASAGELRQRLRAATEALHHGGPMPAGVYYGGGPAAGRLAYLFPGQGVSIWAWALTWPWRSMRRDGSGIARRASPLGTSPSTRSSSRGRCFRSRSARTRRGSSSPPNMLSPPLAQSVWRSSHFSPPLACAPTARPVTALASSRPWVRRGCLAATRSCSWHATAGSSWRKRPPRQVPCSQWLRPPQHSSHCSETAMW